MKNMCAMLRRLAGALALSLAAVQAQAIPLSDLLQGGSIEVGDKLFDGFTLLADPIDPLLGDPIDLGAIDVTGIGDGTLGNEYGLHFQTNLTIGSENPDSFDFLDLFFGYFATATAPGQLIAGVTMAAQASALGADAFATVVKEVVDLEAVSLLGAPMEVFSDTLEPDSLTASAGFAPRSSVFVGDNIALFFSAEQGPSEANLVSFEQRFVQISRDVPAPATVLLMLLGLCGLRLFRARA